MVANSFSCHPSAVCLCGGRGHHVFRCDFSRFQFTASEMALIWKHHPHRIKSTTQWCLWSTSFILGVLVAAPLVSLFHLDLGKVVAASFFMAQVTIVYANNPRRFAFHIVFIRKSFVLVDIRSRKSSPYRCLWGNMLRRSESLLRFTETISVRSKLKDAAAFVD